MEEASGYIERIIFRNEENGYTVFVVSLNDEEITCVGIMNYISEGEYINVKGNIGKHNIYDEQFEVVSYEIVLPQSGFAMEKYLGSGAIKGIGEALAGRIVKKFKEDTFRIIEEEPERLAEIKGISSKKAVEISVQFDEKKEMRQAMMFLQEYGISTTYSVKIFKKYGNELYNIIKQNPYKLAEDVGGIGFKLADEIAEKSGILKNSEYRIKSGVLYALGLAVSSGHTYLPLSILKQRTAEILLIDEIEIENQLMDMHMNRSIIIKEIEEEKVAYISSYYYLELNSAKHLIDLDVEYDIKTEDVIKQFPCIEEQEELKLDELQKMAVIECVQNGVMILTGGPGTGKTTTIKTIIKFFEIQNMEILLAAPTGRAAKRMTETTGYEAQTIHRLLEVSNVSDDGTKNRFEKNEENPLETDIVIIDEMSMVDISLFSALVKAIPQGTRVVFVGDIDQLSSVGAGNVLKDIISSNQFHVVMLTKIFRQAGESDIVCNAHKINKGEHILLDNKSKDFFFLKRTEIDIILQTIVYLVNKKISSYVKADPYDIQVLTPMRKGELGVEKLNIYLQKYLNPSHVGKREKEYKGGIFREGDKIMQVKNNYQLVWEKRNKNNIIQESGTGVFNGDMGVIKHINEYADILEVYFDDGRQVEYPFSQLEELELAYAVTIHKSQGSEYPAVVIPLLNGPRMLLNRNILYTAVTRAKQCAIIIGNDHIVNQMIDNANEHRRYSSLNIRIIEQKSNVHEELEKEKIV